MNWTLRRRLLASFSLIIAIMLAMVGLTYEDLHEIELREQHMQKHPLPGLYYSALLRNAALQDLVALQRLVLDQDLNISPQELEQLFEQDKRIGKLMAQYEQTVFSEHERAAFVAYQEHRQEFNRLQTEVLEFYRQDQPQQASLLLQEKLHPSWMQGETLLDKLVQLNNQAVSEGAAGILSAVTEAKTNLLIAVLLVVIAASLCGYLLLRAILSPVQNIVEALASMRDGNLNVRLVLARQDEFGVIETGFNAMATALLELVAQSQRSSIAVTTSVTEISATSKQQQATATETAAATTEIGATSREIVATSRDLLRTMDEVSSAAEQINAKLATLNEGMQAQASGAEQINQALQQLAETTGQTVESLRQTSTPSMS